MADNHVTSVVFAGLGGQGVLRASDILADVAFHAGFDVKKSEIHGMSQRGGFVTSDVRFGETVFSPMVPAGGAQYLVVLSMDQLDAAKGNLAPDGCLITAEMINVDTLPNAKALNVALLGALSAKLSIDEEVYLKALDAHFPEKLHAANREAFAMGRAAAVE